MDEREEDDTCEKYRYGEEEPSDCQDSCMRTSLDEFVCSLFPVGSLEELDGEEELDATDEETAQVQRYGERTHGHGDLVHRLVLVRCYHSASMLLLLPHVSRRHARSGPWMNGANPLKKEQGEERHEK